MESKLKLVFVILAVTLLTGCYPQTPEQAAVEKAQEASELAADLRYFKDEKGLCYSYISSRTYGGHEVFSITNVPCKAVGL